MAFPTKDLTRSPMPTDADVRNPLERLRGTIRRYVALEGILAVLIFAGSFFWLDLLLDYGPFAAFAFDWVQETPRWFRIVVLAAAALARSVDIYCDEGAFTLDEAAAILEAARGHGLAVGDDALAMVRYLRRTDAKANTESPETEAQKEFVRRWRVEQ